MSNKNLSLYQMSTEYEQALYKMLDDEELTPQIISDTLAGNIYVFREKAKEIAAIYLNLELELDKIEIVHNRLSHRKTVMQNKIKRFKDELLQAMERYELTEISSDEFKIKIGFNPEATFIDDEKQVPDAYTRTEIIPDKMAIKKALQEGFEIPGTHLERTKKLIIK